LVQISAIHTEAKQGNVHSLHQNLPRKSIEEALYDAWMGKPPQNPHNDPELLKAEALIANSIFDQYVRHSLRIAIGAPHYIEGPAKDVGRAITKKGRPGDNCDWARHSNLLNNMRMVALASDMLSKRGVVTLKTTENLPINLYIVDTDNTFIAEDPKKLGLRMINTKFLIPITLRGGEETYHILELRSYLAASEATYQASEEAYKTYRDATSLSTSYALALSQVSPFDGAVQKRLALSWAQANTNAENALLKRTILNQQDAERNGANALFGHTPLPPAPNAKWSLMTYETYMARAYANKDDYSTPAPIHA
jgi:hypothetical protein